VNIRQVIFFIFILSCFFLFFLFYFAYNFLHDTIVSEEIKKARIQSRTVKFYQEFISDSIKKELEFNNSSILEILPIFATKHVTELIKSQDNFYMHIVSDRWRDADNIPVVSEIQAIDYFKIHPKKTEFWEIHSEKSGFGLGTNVRHIFYAYPLYVKRSCLICHGDPEKDIPKPLYDFLSKKYGSKAFYYKEGDLRGIIAMRIPIEHLEKRLIVIFLIIGIAVFLIFIFFLFVFIKLNDYIADDIKKFLEYFKTKISRNRYEKLLEKMNFYEFDRLKKEINKTVDTIKDYKNRLATNHITGLPNRTQFFEHIEKMDKPIMIINVDKFREINSYFDTETGDELIRQIGIRLKDLSKKHDFKVFHLDIDEFALIPEKEITDRTEMYKYAERILKKLEESYFIYNNEILVRFRMGISFDKKEYIKAETALSNAKKLKKDIMFDIENIEIKNNYGEHIRWLRKLKSAIKNERIIPFYQPIYDANKNIVKYEALVRMIDEEGNVVSPFFFLDIAKKSRLYLDITKLVLDKAIKTIRKYNVSVSINITLEDMEDEEMRNFLIQQVSECRYKDKITFEIVENEDIRQSEVIKEFIAKLRHEGVSIYIDDFGSGYANFDYLLKLHPEGVKIDGSLIKNILVDKNSQVMVRTLVNFAKESGIFVVAEYVENESTFNMLKEMGVDYFQGFYFSHPKPEI